MARFRLTAMIDYIPKGWIRIHRELETQDIFKESETLRVFIYLVFRAMTDDIVFREVQIQRGQVVTTYRKLAAALNLSLRKLRTILSRLEATHYVTHSKAHSGTHSFTVITICDYDSYQGSTKNARPNKRHNDTHIERHDPEVSTLLHRKEDNTEKKSIEKSFSSLSSETEKVLIEKLVEDDSWKSTVAKAYNLTETELVKRLDEFFFSNECRGKLHPNVAELKNHFINWLKKIISTKLNTTKDNGTILKGREDKRRGVEAGNRRPEDFEEDF